MSEITLGKRLRELLEENGMTQQKLAENLYISSGTLNGYVKDIRKPEYTTLIKMSKFFHTSCDYLIGNSDKRQSDGEELSAEESRIVEIYRKLNEQGKDFMLDQLKSLYKNFPKEKIGE